MGIDPTTALYALRRLRIHAEDPADAMGALLDTKAVATWLGLSAGTVHRWREIGEGPRFVRLGTGPKPHVRYLVGDVLHWLEEQARGNGRGAAGPAASA